MLLLPSDNPTPPGPPSAPLRLYRSGVMLSLLSCGYAPVGDAVQSVHGKARAWVGLNVSSPQQLLEQVIEFSLFGLHAYAEGRCVRRGVSGPSSVPPDLSAHVLQHQQGLLAHLPNSLRHNEPRPVPLPRPSKGSRGPPEPHPYQTGALPPPVPRRPSRGILAPL